MKVGILYICTGNYARFWNGFYEACEKLFLTDAEKHYFIWTDCEDIISQGNKNNNIHVIYQKVEEWPLPTLRRYSYFLSNKKELLKMDYLIFMNGNLVVKKRISYRDILPRGEERLFVTLSPGPFENVPMAFTYDRNPECSAYIPFGEGQFYFAGGFNGGYSEDYVEMAEVIAKRTEEDYSKGIIARWHDESHINRYMLDYNKPYRILSPAYLFPEGGNQPFECKILILEKKNYGGHEKMRQIK